MTRWGYRRPVPRGWMFAGVVAAAVVALVLVAAALLRDDAATSADSAPPPAFDTSAPPQTKTSSPTPTPPTLDRAKERFFAVAPDALWRATAGECGKTEPKVERSTDRGQTWTDVTPHYRDIAQVASLDQIAAHAASMVTEVGADCTPTGMRTFTDGKFWEPYAGSIDPARYLSFTDASKVVSPGDDYAAPCPDAHSLRASGDLVAVVCDAVADVRVGDDWTALSVSNVAALGIYRGDLYVAHTGAEGCDGIAVTRFAGGDAAASADAGCAAHVIKSGQIAIGPSSLGTFVWSGDDVTLALPPAR